MRRRWLIAIGVAVFLGTAVMRAPVATVYAWMAPWLAGSPVQFLGISGTLGEGRVAQLGFLGRPLVRELSWQFQPWRLLLGQASFQLDGGTEGVVVDGRAGVSATGTVSLGNFRFAGPVKSLLSALGQPAILAGQLGAEMKSMKLKDGWPAHADGTITARGLASALGSQPIILGDYEAAVEDEGDGVKATIRTLAGTLEAQGEVHLAGDRSYELAFKLRTKPDAPPQVVNLLHNIVEQAPDPQGWYTLRRKGSMGGGGAPPAPLPANPRP